LILGHLPLTQLKLCGIQFVRSNATIAKMLKEPDSVSIGFNGEEEIVLPSKGWNWEGASL
jgi:hypothetical protein